jgi:hypothetical protein
MIGRFETKSASLRVLTQFHVSMFDHEMPMRVNGIEN